MSEKHPSRRNPNERMDIPGIQAQRENGAYSHSPNLFRHPLKPFTESLNGDVFNTFKMKLDDHYQNLNHSQFFEPESNLNLFNSSYFFMTI
jgi:hypothetical protein